MEQKSDRERWGGGGGAEGERERENVWASEYGLMRRKERKKKRKKEKNLFRIRPWKRKKASNSKHHREWMGKPEYPGRKPIGRMKCKPYILYIHCTGHCISWSSYERSTGFDGTDQSVKSVTCRSYRFSVHPAAVSQSARERPCFHYDLFYIFFIVLPLSLAGPPWA